MQFEFGFLNIEQGILLYFWLSFWTQLWTYYYFWYLTEVKEVIWLV